MGLGMIQVFISSTISDLKKERNALKNVLNEISINVFLSEGEGASWATSCGKCLSEIEKSDIFVLILGEKYGYIPSEETTYSIFNGDISVTHGELLYAIKLNKPILVYIKDCMRESELNDFIKDIENFSTGYFRKKFAKLDELESSVKSDILRTITELVRGTYRYPDLPKPRVILCRNQVEAFKVGATMICEVLEKESVPIFGFMPGRTAGGIYSALVSKLEKNKEIPNSLLRMVSFHVSEHFGLSGSAGSSYQSWMNNSLYNRLEIALKFKLNRKTIHFIPGIVSSGNVESECQKYDALVSSSTMHLQLIGLAPNGQSMHIDPGIYTKNDLLEQGTTLVKLSDDTFNYLTPKPAIPYSITIGMGNILRYSQGIALFAFGKSKAQAVRDILIKTDYSNAPCTVLRHHHNFTIIIDEEAASLLPKNWDKYFHPINCLDLLNIEVDE